MHSNVVLSGECTYVCVGFSKPQKDREREMWYICVNMCASQWERVWHRMPIFQGMSEIGRECV